MLGKNNSLSDYIIQCLATEPAVAVKVLVKKIEIIAGQKYSIQGIYKELRNLQASGVLIKIGPRYSLRLPWVLDFVAVADTMVDTYVEKPHLPLLLPQLHKKQIWHFTNLLKMNDFWSHILLALVQQSKSKVLLGWNPHPWFHLVQTKQEEQYIQALKSTKSKLYLIVGGNSFLDKWAAKFWDSAVVEHSFGESSFQKERSLYFNVIDDWVVTVKLDSKTSEAIDTVYESTKSMADLNLQTIISVFQQKTKCSFWLEKNSKKAKNIKSQFKRFWGVDFVRK